MIGRAHNTRRLVLAVLAAGLACTAPATDTAFITDGAGDRVMALDVRSGALLDSIPVDPRPFETDEPHGIAHTPDGRYLLVTVAHGESTLWKLELPGLRLVGRVALGIPGGSRIGVTPDGRTAFVPDYYRDDPAHVGMVAMVDVHELKVLRTIPTCTAPHEARPDPSGTLVAVTCSGSDEIVVLDARSGAELRKFSVDQGAVAPARPLNLVWTGHSDTLFVTLHAVSRLAGFTPDGRLVGSWLTGAGPAQVARTEGGTVVVANRLDGTVSVGKPGSGPLATIPLGGEHPHGVAISSDGEIAVVTYEGSINTLGGAAGIDLATRRVIWRTDAGSYTLGVTVVTPAR